MDKDIQELLDSFYSKSINVKGEPLGKINQFYPGASPLSSDPEYKTYTQIDQYTDKLQQSIENRDVLLKEEEGLGVEEEEFDIGEIGRIYELKKIFSRLISLESFLADSGDNVLIKLSSYTSESVNLFKLVIDNIDQYIDQIDDIIIIFYEYLHISYKILSKYYDKQAETNYDEGDL